jgi:hypothetical protein
MGAGFLRDLQRRSVALGGVPLAAPARKDRRHRQASRYPAVRVAALFLSEWKPARSSPRPAEPKLGIRSPVS